MKKTLSALLSLLMLLCLFSCSRVDISVDDAIKTFNELLPTADAVNIILFGEGLQAVDDAYTEDHASTAYFPVYDMSTYPTVDSLKELAESVYSENYLDSVYVSVFEGVHAEDGSDVGIVSARYKDMNEGLYVDVSNKGFEIRHLKSVRSAKVKERTKTYASFDCVCLDTAGNEVNATLFLTEINGNWRLDGPTY